MGINTGGLAGFSPTEVKPSSAGKLGAARAMLLLAPALDARGGIGAPRRPPPGRDFDPLSIIVKSSVCEVVVLVVVEVADVCERVRYRRLLKREVFFAVLRSGKSRGLLFDDPSVRGHKDACIDNK